MEVKILLRYLKMILENDQNNILEAKIVMFVVHTFCEVVILRVFDYIISLLFACKCLSFSRSLFNFFWGGGNTVYYRLCKVWIYLV